MIPDAVSDYIREHSINLVTVNSGAVAAPAPATSWEDYTKDGVSHSLSVPAHIHQAILAKDVATVRNAHKANATDLKANLDSVRKHGNDAFITVRNKLDGKEYQLCPSDDGWIWAFSDKPSPGSANKVTPTVVIGTFSKKAKFLGVSVTTLTNIPTLIADVIVGSFVASLITKFLTRRFEGAALKAALQAAEEAAAAGVSEFSAQVEISVLRRVVHGLIGGVGGALAGIVLIYVINWVRQDYGLEITVYNWDPKEKWDIVEWYGENEHFDGEGFRTTTLKAAGEDDKDFQANFTIVDPNALGASYATYTVENDGKWLSGVGAGLKLVSQVDSNRIIYLKYNIEWPDWSGFGLGNNKSGSLKEFFKNHEWVTSSTDTTIKIDASGGKPEATVIALLRDKSDNFHHFDVHVAPEAAVKHK